MQAVKGLGVDIIEIDRMRGALEREPRMKERVFTAGERSYCESKSRSFVHYALRFAAKEAAVKALGTGFRGLRFTDIEVSRDGKGKGDFNSGRYKDDILDRLIDAVEVEMDPARRRGMMLEAFQRVRENVYTIPLHRQMIPWAARAGITAVHRPDNVIEPLWIRVD